MQFQNPPNIFEGKQHSSFMVAFVQGKTAAESSNGMLNSRTLALLFCYYFDIFPQILVFLLKIVDVRGRTRNVLLVPNLQLAFFDLHRLA